MPTPVGDLAIALVIPAHNEEKSIGECLAAVLQHAPGRFQEIVVIDNASTDQTAAAAGRFPGVRVVREERKGTGFARDRGWRETSAPLIAYLDADTRLRAGWVELVLEHFTNDPRTVCVSGPYWYYDLSPAARTLLWGGSAFGLPLHWLLGSMVIGGNFAIRRDTLEQMGGMDTSILFHGDDTDIGRRAHALGRVRFSFALTLDSSGRRYKKFGTLRTHNLYIKNQIASAFGLRSWFTKGYDEVR